MLFKSRRNEYADTDGPVRYLDDSGLRRPLDMPRPQIAIMFAFVLVAALIGGYLLFNVLDAVRGGTARAQASVEENLSREVSYDLPALTSYITLNDDEIKQAVADAGLTVIDKGGMSDDPEAALELIKLPSDVSELDAGPPRASIRPPSPRTAWAWTKWATRSSRARSTSTGPRTHGRSRLSLCPRCTTSRACPKPPCTSAFA